MTSICHLVIRPTKAVEILMERTLTLLTSRCHGNARDYFHTRTHSYLFVDIMRHSLPFLFYLYHILSSILLASVMSGNELAECVKSPTGKFLFSLTHPYLLWAYPASYPQSTGTPVQGGKVTWNEIESRFVIRFCR